MDTLKHGAAEPQPKNPQQRTLRETILGNKRQKKKKGTCSFWSSGEAFEADAAEAGLRSRRKHELTEKFCQKQQ
jgi:hypothetical protein